MWRHPRSFDLLMLNEMALDRAGKTYWIGKQVSREALD
jgi:hypothetical protein